MSLTREELILQLYQIDAIQFGEFKLKSGLISPLYIDLRMIISYPKLLKQIAQQMQETIQGKHYDCVCGVPYTALPLATALSLLQDIPMVMRRKEAKEYGTKKIIEGRVEKGNRCLLIEDLITSGSSLFETITPLEQEGLIVNDILVILDRQQGGKEKIEARGYHLYSLLTMEELLNTLHTKNIIDSPLLTKIKQFLRENRC